MGAPLRSPRSLILGTGSHTSCRRGCGLQKKHSRASARWGSLLLSLLSFRLCVQCKASRLPGFIPQPRRVARSGLCGLRQVATGVVQAGVGRLSFPWRTWPWGPWRFSSLAFTPPQSSCSKLFISEKTNTRVSPPPPASCRPRIPWQLNARGQLQVRPTGDAERIQV